jgi:hypothetical protein
MGSANYILIGKLAVPEPDLMKWATWYETANRHVANTQIGGIWVSTVFLGVDHNFGAGLPILFETMVFRGGSGNECVRCESWDEAEKQHADMVELVRREIREKVND